VDGIGVAVEHVADICNVVLVLAARIATPIGDLHEQVEMWLIESPAPGEVPRDTAGCRYL